MRLINDDFSYRSAICPAKAEKTKKGVINKIAARLMMLVESDEPE